MEVKGQSLVDSSHNFFFLENRNTLSASADFLALALASASHCPTVAVTLFKHSVLAFESSQGGNPEEAFSLQGHRGATGHEKRKEAIQHEATQRNAMQRNATQGDANSSTTNTRHLQSSAAQTKEAWIIIQHDADATTG